MVWNASFWGIACEYLRPYFHYTRTPLSYFIEQQRGPFALQTKNARYANVLFYWILCLVQWRGKWQAGIRCARADWPLSTLKAKPTHDRKKYFVIFFPHTRNYSWADMMLVCSIHEFPQPIAYKTHQLGLKMVKDLTVARRFIMQKLAVGMLNIVDQIHLDVSHGGALPLVNSLFF